MPNNILTKKLYIFSGLGADESVFQKLDFSDYSVTYIQWVIPQSKETIEDYAARLIDQIPTTKPTLIGLSFGGIMAIEVAKQIDVEEVIIISSVKTKNELPSYYRFAGKLGLHKLLPPSFLKRSNFITNWFFGTSSTFDKQLLKQILIDTNPQFLKWAMDKIVHWKNETVLSNIYHIHGTNDRILPFRNVYCDMTIKNGGHLMVLNKSEELNSVLRLKLLNSVEE